MHDPNDDDVKPSDSDPHGADAPSLMPFSGDGSLSAGADTSPDDRTRRAGTLSAVLDRLHSATNYGPSTLRLMSDMPKRADACLLPDGTRTDARVVCLPPNWRSAKDEGRTIDPSKCVWQRALPHSQLARRGGVMIDPNPDVGLRFVDDPHAGSDWGADEERAPSPERDLASSSRIMDLCGSDAFATLLYAALCNTTWRGAEIGAHWHCSWRYAGGVLAHIRGEGDYLDWYCNGGEGMVDEQVLFEIEALGWSLVREGPTNDPDEW